MNVEVLSWIGTGCPWAAGIAIFNKYCKSPVLEQLFASGESSFTSRKLREALEKIPAAKQHPKSSNLPVYTIDVLPNHLRPEFLRKGEIYKLSSQLHVDLQYAKTDKERAELYSRIKSSFDEIDTIWQKCDDHVLGRSGTMETVEEELKPVDLIQKRNNLRSRISKVKNKNPEKALLLVKELAEIEIKLNQA